MTHTYMIFAMSEVSSIDFSEVLEDSPETLRLSVDGTKSFVKWETPGVPTSVNALTTKEGPYTYTQILEILSQPFWADFPPLVPTSGLSDL